MIMPPVLPSFLYVFLLIFKLYRVQFFFLYLPHVFIYTEPVKFHLDHGPKNTLSCTSAKCANGTFCPAFFPLHEHSHQHYFPGTVSGEWRWIGLFIRAWSIRTRHQRSNQYSDTVPLKWQADEINFLATTYQTLKSDGFHFLTIWVYLRDFLQK